MRLFAFAALLIRMLELIVRFNFDVMFFFCDCGVNADGGTPQLFLTLTTKAFEELRGRFGITRHVGRSMPPELQKSWSYLQHAWNNHARTPVVSAIEAAIEAGDNNFVVFRLFGTGSTKNKKQKKKNRIVKAVNVYHNIDYSKENKRESE